MSKKKKYETANDMAVRLSIETADAAINYSDTCYNPAQAQGYLESAMKTIKRYLQTYKP